jgi:predicted AAA+ superfamily ATPase
MIERAALSGFIARLREPRRFLQVVAGPRQVGKTTMVAQALAQLAGVPAHSASADSPGLQPLSWVAVQWEMARALAAQHGRAVLVLDEIQKIPHWTDEVKRLWDEDTRARRDLRVVVLGSAPLLIERGLTESLAGRFEITRLAHWSYAEMHQAFGFTLEQFIFFGGYPGAAPLVGDEQRWAAYVRDALIETTIGKDVLLMAPVHKPALLRRVFDLACRYSGQVLSYTKMMGTLQDAGNTTTLAHYLDLLAGAGMVCGLQKTAGQAVRQRGSSPKLQVFNTALMGSLAVHEGYGFQRVRADPALWGRLVESAVGAQLLAWLPAGAHHSGTLGYWREGALEVDFVVRRGGATWAIEVKSGRARASLPGLDAFAAAFPGARPMRVGSGGMPLERWFERPLFDV